MVPVKDVCGLEKNASCRNENKWTTLRYAFSSLPGFLMFTGIVYYSIVVWHEWGRITIPAIYMYVCFGLSDFGSWEVPQQPTGYSGKPVVIF
jgi:hypothetical protein